MIFKVLFLFCGINLMEILAIVLYEYVFLEDVLYTIKNSINLNFQLLIEKNIKMTKY